MCLHIVSIEDPRRLNMKFTLGNIQHLRNYSYEAPPPPPPAYSKIQKSNNFALHTT